MKHRVLMLSCLKAFYTRSRAIKATLKWELERVMQDSEQGCLLIVRFHYVSVFRWTYLIWLLLMYLNVFTDTVGVFGSLLRWMRHNLSCENSSKQKHIEEVTIYWNKYWDDMRFWNTIFQPPSVSFFESKPLLQHSLYACATNHVTGLETL